MHNTENNCDRKIIHEIRELQKALNPPSELHRRRDVEELKKRVLAVETLIQNQIAQNVARDVKGDMELGLKGIVAVKQPAKPKVQKPELRIDDEGYDDYEHEYELEEEERDAVVKQDEREGRDKPIDTGVAVEVVQSNYVEKTVPRESGRQEEEGESAMNVDVEMEHQSLKGGVDRGEEEKTTRHTQGRFSQIMQQSLPWLPVNFHEYRSGAEYIDYDDDEEESGGLLMQSLTWIPM